jgi:hypothetical protein
MYGLKQAAVLAYDHLINNLEPHGYHPCKFSTGLWTHTTRKTKFCLCVDDFGIKFFNQEDADHLLATLSKYYTITVDRKGQNYCGLHINWDYTQGTVNISMHGNVDKVLSKFQHPSPKRPCFAPHPWTIPAYGQKTQFAPEVDNMLYLDSKGIKKVQLVVGSFLYYAQSHTTCCPK